MKRITTIAIYVLGLIVMLSGGLNGQNRISTTTFGSCEMPEGWEVNIESGGVGFIIEEANQANPDYGDNCVLFFLDNNRPGKGDSSKISITSPYVQPLNSDSVFIDFQINFVKVAGKPQVLEVFYEQDGQEHLFATYDTTIWGATFNDFANRTIKMANPNNTPIRVVIKYDNHGEANGLIGFDNFIFRGYDSGICDRSISIEIAPNFCHEGNNNGLYDGSMYASCQGIQTSRPTWYEFVAQANGFVRLNCNSNFNDVVDVYYGFCGNLTPFRCSNRDEYGFDGEDLFFNITQGINYYIRVSGHENAYGVPEGQFCLSLESIPQLPQAEPYDFCSGALEVKLDEGCVKATNVMAGMDGPVPSLNTKSRADIFFKYYHDTDEKISILTNADFADVITILSGGCFFPTEVTGTDHGPNFDNVQLTKGQEYIIQVSGYFSTLEGDVCLEIKTFDGEEPMNDLCVDAQLLSLNNRTCIDGSTHSATNSGVKSSCQIHDGPDIWYEFTSDNGGKHFLEVNADFIYDIALYTGDCDSLIEVNCQYNPHRCEGYVQWENLEADRTYYIQISSHQNSLGVIRGEVCLSIYEEGQEPQKDFLTIEAEIECLAGEFGVLNLNVSGGQGQLSYFGNKDGDIIRKGESYQVIVDDEENCRSIAEGFGQCNELVDCSTSNLEISVTLECELDQFGLPTGRAFVRSTATGGSGQLTYLALKDGDLVDADQNAIVAVQDETGCLKIFEGRNDCKPYTCDQGKLAIQVDYDCIDSLFKAQLKVSATDGVGTYSFTGDSHGDLFDQGATFTSVVTDEKGCTDSISGMIDCVFDSCVFSALHVNVIADCITDQDGKRTGQAVLRIVTQGGIGQLDINGNQDGDTLNQGEMYEVIVRDEWGCNQTVVGEVDCTPVSTSHHDNSRISTLYPNPTQHWAMMEYQSPSTEKIWITLISEDGKKVFKISQDAKVGINQIPLIFGELSNGIYVVQSIQGNYVSVHRLAITR